MSQVKCKQVNILSGGTYSQLSDLVEKHLPNNIDPKIVYFIAGIPDICTLTRYTNTVNCMLGTKTIRANPGRFACRDGYINWKVL
jgi:lysophospholipase L1-like esterase